MDLTTEQLTDIAGQVRDFLLADSQGVGELTNATDLTGITSLPALKKTDGAESVVNVPISLLTAQMRVTLTAVQYKNPLDGVWTDIVLLSEINGKSAYEVAKALNPALGTESEWIASLSKDSKDAAAAAVAATQVMSTQVGAALSGIDAKVATATSTLKTELTAKVVSEVANKVSKPLVVSGDETECGTFNLFGEIHTIYEKTFQLTDLPDQLNTSEFILSDEPLGYNLYASIQGFCVFGDKALKSDFYNNNYEITKIYVNNNMQTVAVIHCKVSSVQIGLRAIIHLRYIKFFGDMVEFNVAVPAGVDPATVALSFPKLKYNKKNVAAIAIDDSYSIWNNLFNVINKKWVDDEKMSYWSAGDERAFFYHMDFSFEYYGVTYTKTTGHIPAKALEYTTGGGVKKRFAASVATWPAQLGTKDTVYGWGAPWNSAKETLYMFDFGNTVDYHDVDGEASGITQDAFNDAVKASANAFNSVLGLAPKVMQTPNGDVDYINYFWNCPYLQFIMDNNARSGATGTFDYYYPFDASIDISNKSGQRIIRRDFMPGDYNSVAMWVDRILSDAALPEAQRRFLVIGCHRVATGLFEADLIRLDNALGASGNDTLWLPSINEFFEYQFMINNTVAVKSVNGQTINYKLFVPTASNFWFRDLSVLLSGISSLTGLTVTSSDNCKGTSFGISDGKLLVNLDFNASLIEKAEKYVSKFETSLTDTDYDDALYFVQQLKVGIRETYQARLDVLASPPSLSSVIINAGATTTTSPAITLAATFTGAATSYMISENAAFTGASWQDYVASIPYTLSNTSGTKTVYLKLKNSHGESVVVSDTIDLSVVAFALNSVSINSDAASTINKAVTVALNLSGDVPTHYMISESAAFSGAVWVAFTINSIPFTLSDVIGTKTVYVKVKTATQESAVKSDTINLIDGAKLTAISINAGATETTSQNVSVAMTTTGTPTHYMISESAAFTGASWIAFATPASFALSTGYGTKTLYVKIKDANGESSVVSGTIGYVAQSEIGRKMVICTPMDSGGAKLSTNPLTGIKWNDITTEWCWSAQYGVNNKQFYDINGTAMGFWVTKPSNDTDGAVSHFLGGPGCIVAGIGTWDGRIGNVNSFTNTTSYAKEFFYDYLQLKDAEKAAVSKDKACPVLIKGVPAGTYRVKIYVLGKDTDDYKSSRKYFVNDAAEQSYNDSMPANPFASPLTFETAAWNGCLVIGAYATTADSAIPFNFIEIERIA